MTDFIGVEVQGLAELKTKLDALPAVVQDYVVDEVTKYYLNVFRDSQPPPNYVTRKAAYGVTFFTPRQRRWFFAALRDGTIDVPYRRTGGLRKSWRQVGSGARSFIVNDSPGAPFVVGDDTQSRHEKLVGWFRTNELMEQRIERAMKIADGATKKAIKKLGLA